MGRWPEAELAQHKAAVLGPGLDGVRLFSLFRAYLRDDLAEAERIARAQLDVGTETQRTESLSELVTVLRYRGRLREAQDFARRHAERGAAPYRAQPELGPAPLGFRLDEAIVHLEAGRPLESARVFEAIAAEPRLRAQEPSTRVRQRAWRLTHAMTARAAAGDTAGLRARAEELEATLRAARLTHPHYRHYPAGLLALARGDTARAIAELRTAITSYTVGYTRASMTLARLLLGTGRPAEAVAALQPGLRGDIQGQNLYVTRPALHEALAEAWDAVARTTTAPAAPGPRGRGVRVARHRGRSALPAVGGRAGARPRVARLRAPRLHLAGAARRPGRGPRGAGGLRDGVGGPGRGGARARLGARRGADYPAAGAERLVGGAPRRAGDDDPRARAAALVLARARAAPRAGADARQ
jgi:hypothetical protein